MIQPNSRSFFNLVLFTDLTTSPGLAEGVIYFSNAYIRGDDTLYDTVAVFDMVCLDARSSIVEGFVSRGGVATTVSYIYDHTANELSNKIVIKEVDTNSTSTL